MGRYALDMEKYADLARTASAEGCVLLKNDNSTLPLKKGDKVEVILDSIFDKKAYQLRVSKHPYTAMCVDVFNEEEKKNGITVTKYINSENIHGKKYIYIKINGKIYNTNQYVIF